MSQSRTCQTAAVCLLLVAALAERLGAQDWPQFRGITRTGVSAEKGLLRSWPQGGPELLWTAEGCGEGYSSVTVSAGRIYTAGRVGDAEKVLCFDLNGKLLWSVANGQAWTTAYPGARGTPTIYQGRAYHLSAKGRLVCLDAANGKEIWAVDLQQRLGAKLPQWAMAESVLAVEDKIICTPGVENATMAALDAATGKTVWQTRGIPGTTSYCSVLPVFHAGRKQLITMVSKAVLGVDADSGALLWQHPHETPYDVHAATPVYADGRVYISSGYGTGGVQLRLPDKPGAGPTVAWSNKLLDNHHGGMVLIDGHIYGAGDKTGKGWICLDFKTGAQKYAERGVGKGSVFAADGLLFCLSERGEVALVKADPAKHEILGRFRLPKGGTGPSWAHPVVAGGRLFVRHGDLLFAFKVGAVK